MNDAQWEKKLNIRTSAADFEKDDSHHSRYEPTSYAVLERLAASGRISASDNLVDYGCGKGRVGFFLNYVLGCGAVGVEYSESLCRLAERNLSDFSGKNRGRIRIAHISAEKYQIDDANAFYFFNPFSAEILRAVLNRIFDSYYEKPRPLRLFFYYALDEYLALLMTDSRLQFTAEIDCRDLFPGDNPREKILIFEIN